MTDQYYTTSFVVDNSPAEVFAAVNNVRDWWSGGIEGPTDALGAEFKYHFQDLHRCTIKIEEFVPGELVVWHVTDNYFSFIEDSSEWVDTTMRFEISKEGDKTKLNFIHVGLLPTFDCYSACSDGWGAYVGGSLKNLITTGTGQANVGEALTDSEAALA